MLISDVPILKKIPIKTIRTSVYLLICTFIFSCAQVVAPGGGPKDILPPKVLKYSPDSAQLNFTSKKIQIDFDEYVQLKDLNNQLIISPPLAKTPDITVKNKTVIIDLDKQELKPNTTYSFNFGNAIQDLNENNPISDFKYIFSTGSFIDSLSVKGNVRNAFNHTTEKGVLVMLYSDMSDSAVYKTQPDYFAKTTEDGNFKITNIKIGKYKIVALKDANANYKYDGDGESIGFSDSIIDPSEKKARLNDEVGQEIKLELFQEPSKKIYLKKYIHDSYGKIVLVFNQGSDSLRVTNLTNGFKGVQELLEYSTNKDTLTYWVKNFEKDSLKLQVNNGTTILDTVEFKMIKKEDALKNKKHPLKLTLVNNFNGSQSFDINTELKLIFSQPIEEWKSGSYFKEDTVYLNKKKRLTYYQHAEGDPLEIVLVGTIDSINSAGGPPDSKSKKDAEVIKPFDKFKENTHYELFIPPGTFTDFLGVSNDTIKLDFKTQEEKFYGSLKLKVEIPDPKGYFYVVQLLDEKENVVRTATVYKGETIEWLYLHPQKYKLKVIQDKTFNSNWDSGNYLKKIQPEKVIYYNDLINVRSNWDLDLEWKITE